jgi:hypothetical protein
MDERIKPVPVIFARIDPEIREHKDRV